MSEGLAVATATFLSRIARYVSGATRLVRVSAAVTGGRSLGVAIGVGVLSKIALLGTFILAIKLLVFIISAPATDKHLMVLGTPVEIPLFVLATSILLVAAFTLSGVLIYVERKLVSANLTRFTAAVRQRNLQRYFDVESPETGRERRELIYKFFARSDPQLKRASRILLMGAIDVIKNAALTGTVCLVLAFQNLLLFLLLFTALAIALPFYVTLTTRSANENRLAIQRIDASLDAERTRVMNEVAGEDGDLCQAPGALAETIAGPLDVERSRIEASGYTGSLGTYPIIYAMLGLAFSLLLVLLVMEGLPASREQITEFVIIGFVLRFVAGTIYGVLNSLRLLNSEYYYIHTITGLFATEPRATSGDENLREA